MTSTAWEEPDDDGESRYAIIGPDPLGILASTRQVVEDGEQVWINKDQLELLSIQWSKEFANGSLASVSSWNDAYHFHDGSPRTVNWLLLLDALNFCFWPDKDQPRWSIEYKGETLNGYWAEAAALKRAVEEDVPLWDAQYLSTISVEVMEQIFRGQHMIPLLEQRVAHAREVGQVLLEHFDGQFTNAVEQAHNDAIHLVQLLIEYFPSFRDVAWYRQHEVRLYKRAQICVADLNGSFHGQSLGALQRMDELTAFADYKLPQVLRHYHILEYDLSLAERIDARELIPAGSAAEVEIRAATIWACELLRRALQNRGITITASEVDQLLWYIGQQSTSMRPYHRTRTVFY